VSILNLAIVDERTAVVVVDSAVASLADQSAPADREASKALPLPHMNAVIAGRGVVGVLALSATLLLGLTTFDEAVQFLPEVVDQAQASMTAAGIAGPQEIAFVGWSARDARMRAYYLQRPTRDVPFEVHEVDYLAAPEHEPAALLPRVLQTDAGAAQFAREQYAAHPGPGFGGRIIVVRLTPTTVCCSIAGELESGPCRG
jgi:hypothetical protein